MPNGAEEVFQLRRKTLSQGRIAVVPLHLDTVRPVAEILQIEFEETVGLQAHKPVESVDEVGFSIWGQAHNFEFVTIVQETEVLGDGCVEHPQGVREANLFEDLEAIVFPDRHRGADKVAKAVQSANGGFLKRRNEEGAGQVRWMVFDVVNLR